MGSEHLSILAFIRGSIFTLSGLMGLTRQVSWPGPAPGLGSLSGSFIQQLFPIMKYGNLVIGSSETDRCTVCLNEFQDHEGIRRLTNCGHIFHRGCVDRWMDYDQRTCPLCRTPFLPHDLLEFIHEFDKCSVPEFGGDFSPMNACL